MLSTLKLQLPNNSLYLCYFRGNSIHLLHWIENKIHQTYRMKLFGICSFFNKIDKCSQGLYLFYSISSPRNIDACPYNYANSDTYIYGMIHRVGVEQCLGTLANCVPALFYAQRMPGNVGIRCVPAHVSTQCSPNTAVSTPCMK